MCEAGATRSITRAVTAFELQQKPLFSRMSFGINTCSLVEERCVLRAVSGMVDAIGYECYAGMQTEVLEAV